MARELLLIRHAQSEANIGISLSPDSTLTPAGVEQARALGQRLRHFDLTGFVGLVSPYQRTQNTAREISNASGLSFIVDELIREWGDVATINGKEYPQETTVHLTDRLREFLRVHEGRKLIVISHAAPIAVLTQLAWGETPNTQGPFWNGVGNCCVRWLKTTYEPKIADDEERASR